MRTTKTQKHAWYLAVALLLGFSTDTLQAQSNERTVSGVVTSSNGAVPYAAVVLKGTTVGVQADENGAFTFPQKLKEQDVLVISSMAFKEHEVTITGDTSYIEPFLEGTEIIIVGALRTKPAHTTGNN